MDTESTTGNALPLAAGDMHSGLQCSADASVRRWRSTLCVLFFLSGFPALIYQLVWQRSLFRIFGVNIESVTVVVTAFMLGLGLGSLAGGWLSKQRRLPLLPLLATIELLTGIFGIFSLSIFDAIGDVALGLPLPATAAVALMLILVPTLLMGATLPVLVGHLVRQSGNVGSSVGLLYYVNTLGAGAACLISAVVLFPMLGMQDSVFVAVAMNAAVAVGALIAHARKFGAPDAESTAPVEASPRAAALRFRPVLLLAFAGGAIALSYEIFFFRVVSYASGSGASAFATTLGAFLVGLASGSRQASEWCGESMEHGARQLLAGMLKANLVGLLFLPVLAHAPLPGGLLLGACLMMVYLLARYWGALLPCLAHFGVTGDSHAGMRTALLYLANIAGSACGSILTGFLLMEYLNLMATAVVLVIAGAGSSLLLAVWLPLPRPVWQRQAAGAAVLGAIALVALPTLASGVLERMQWKGEPVPGGSFARVIENRSGIITVDKEGTVYGGGMYDGRFNIDLMHDSNGIVRPYALSLFHHHPHDVLMIGLSSGSWAQVIANNPQVRSLTIVEINPGYRQLIAGEPEVASLLSNPKVSIVTDDGRRWLRLNPDRRFDAIVSNTTWHFRSNATNLLSAEFLTLAGHHLKSDGIIFYNTTDSARVQRTGCLAFPYGARFTNHMVLSRAPLAWDFDDWRRTLEDYRIDGRLIVDPGKGQDRVVAAGVAQLQAAAREDAGSGRDTPIESCARVLARTSGLTPVTDDNMGTEWRHTLGLD